MATVNDLQRSKVIAAEEEIWLSEFNPELPQHVISDLINEVCNVNGLPPLAVEFTEEEGARLLVADGHITLPAWALRPLPVLHSLAHLLTDSTFPTHGAEFVATWVRLVESYASPALAEQLRKALDGRHVHRDAKKRQVKSRRMAVFVANNEPGLLCICIMDDPPERIIGPLEEVCDRNRIVVVGGRELPLERARYIFRMEPER